MRTNGEAIPALHSGCYTDDISPLSLLRDEWSNTVSDSGLQFLKLYFLCVFVCVYVCKRFGV